MGKLAGISGREAVKKFQKLGYQVTRQRGSHVRLHHVLDAKRKPITVPMYRELKFGLLRQIIKNTGITIEEFLQL